MKFIMSNAQHIDITYEAAAYTATFSWEDNVVIADGKTHTKASKELIHVDIMIPAIHFVFTPPHKG